ncbi:MAG: beta-ketoacyl-[acyl-carrier-protein] synthase family protein [Candidatus Omnitrophota bacterium]|jgi:3-oxoacyl-[acyl-carrier-protein] synthase II
MHKRIVITGLGIISPIGIGREEFWKALEEGRSGIKSITRFDTNEFKAKLAGEVSDFKPADFLGEKVTKDFNRTTRFLCSAAKLALEESGLTINEENTDDFGVCTGTTLSSLWNIAEFDREVIKDGPLFTNVALFPGTVVNAASSQVSILFNVQGFNATISTGFTSSLDALKYAVDFIKLGRAKAVILGAVETLATANFIGFYNLGFLAGIKGEEISCPFDKRRNGIILSEGAAVVIIEDAEYAEKRKARILAEIKGVSTYFDAYRMGRYQSEAKGLKESMKGALKNSRLKTSDISYIAAAANSVVEQDKLETYAIKEVFSRLAHKVPVSSIKSNLGELFSAAGLMQMASAVGSINRNFIPATINYRIKDPECDLDYVTNRSRQTKVNNILINNSGPGGNNASCVVSRYH